MGLPNVDGKVASSTVVVAVYLSCWCCICDQLVARTCECMASRSCKTETSEDPKIFMAKFIRGSSLLGMAKAKKQVFVNGGVGSFTAIGDSNDDFPEVLEQELLSF